MKLNSDQLQAFLACAQKKQISLAAISLGLTQSAMTQRIQKLESNLGCTLFLRQKSGLTLTAAGLKLLKHVSLLQTLEQEAIRDLDGYQDELSGTIRIAGFSSIMRSVVIPSLSSMLRQYPNIHIEFSSHEVIELESLILSGKADFVISDIRFSKSGIVENFIGLEEYVVIESKKNKTKKNTFLDHGFHDNATVSFFASQTKIIEPYQRNFMGDVYSIIDGVSLGLGKAVMSKHLITNRKDIKIKPGYKKYTREVILHHFEQPYYPKLWKEVLRVIKNNQVLEK